MTDHSQPAPGDEAGAAPIAGQDPPVREHILTDNGMLTPRPERTSRSLGAVPSSYGSPGGPGDGEPTDGEPRNDA